MRCSCPRRCGDHRVVRGGSWNNSARRVRVANRNRRRPGNRNPNQGFRLVRRPQPRAGSAGSEHAACSRPVHARPGRVAPAVGLPAAGALLGSGQGATC
ncbi:MAG: SUMF1/EgtB/PvdO family nonheme iron enzyme [Myxococcales bacterium]|nr:SUMF1/EgtB/PvdO family nonheme iron enzyme [Myxococcales bacterium]